MTLSWSPLLLFLCVGSALSFQSIATIRSQPTTGSTPTLLHATVNRRSVFQQVACTLAVATLRPISAAADDPLEMKLFVDPVGYFLISTPSNFFRLRRSAKGDLPDATTGKGRRGSSIFTAGDMSKAEVVAVER